MTNKILSFPCVLNGNPGQTFLNGFLLTIRRNDKTIIGNKKGYLLPMVIIYMIIAAIIGSGILVLGSFDRIEANKRLHREQAFYLAEAGINYARFKLEPSGSWVPSPNPMTINLGDGTFQLQEAVNANTILITSTGTVNMVSEKTSITFTKGGGGSGAFSQGIFGASSVMLNSGTVINGNVGTGISGSMTLNGTAAINGTAYLGGSSAPSGSVANISGGYVNNYAFASPLSSSSLTAVTIPSSLSSLAYVNQGDSRITGSYTISSGALTVNSGTVTITPVTGNANFHFSNILVNSNCSFVIKGTVQGMFYFDGNGITLNSGTSTTQKTTFNIGTFSTAGSAVMYFGSTASLILGSYSTINNLSGDPINLQVYSKGTQVTLNSNSSIVQGVVYAPNASVILNSSTTFSGGIVAKNLTLNGNPSTVTYNINLKTESFPLAPGGGGSTIITFVSWTKPDWKR